MNIWKVLLGSWLSLGIVSLHGQANSTTQGIKVSELQALSSGAKPRGTFYLLSSITDGRPAPPWPSDPYGGARPLYLLNAQRAIYLIGDAAVPVIHPEKFPAGTFSSGEASFDEMLATMAGFDLEMSVMESGSGAYSFSSDDLWLEIAGKTNNTGHFIIHAPAAESGVGVYDVFVTHSLSPDGTGLNLTNWQWLMRCAPGQTNLAINGLVASQAYFLLGRTNSTDSDSLSDAFERLVSHSSTTNPDTDGDQMPDDWEWDHFGSFAQTGSDDYDSDGTSDILEYLNGTDPNTVRFSVSCGNRHLRTVSAPLTIQILGGVPSSMAILVDTENFSSGAWSTCDLNPTVSLPGTQGWHVVWVGLTGKAIRSERRWRTVYLKLDSEPPVLTITNPVSSVLTSPLIQLQGYSPEALERISFDLTNAAGTLIDQPVFVTSQDTDSENLGFSTNHFQAFDIYLTNGANVVTLRATDLAGNETVTNLNFTVDYANATNPPALQIAWPHDGAQISGTQFTWDGWVDDPNATIRAEIVNPNGVTNTFHGMIGRGGKFWIENVPLFSGATNEWTITAVNSAGNITVTNLGVAQSSLVLAMDPVSESQLWNRKVNVTGTISSPDHAVWVNGVKGTNNGNGYWSAANVPMTEGGTATFEVTAYAPDEQQPDGSFGN